MSTIKIDRSIVKNILLISGYFSFAKAIIKMREALVLEVIAKGIADEEIINYLKTLGRPTVQDYFYSRPLPIEDLELWLKGDIPKPDLNQPFSKINACSLTIH